MRYNSSENGRSMIEMLGVLAIVGILSTGAISSYSTAMTKHKVNKTTDQLTQVSFNIRNAFLGRRNYRGVEDLNTLIALNVFPSEMISQETVTLGGGVLQREPRELRKVDTSAKQASQELRKVDTSAQKARLEAKSAITETKISEVSSAKKISELGKELGKISDEEKRLAPIEASPTRTAEMTTVRHAFKDYVDVYLADKNTENDSAAFVLAFRGLPNKACSTIVSQSWENDEGILSVGINTAEDITSYECKSDTTIFCGEDNISFSDIVSACNNETNDIAFKFH